jgi:UDP-4-amino-4,6-dideoxy-N-acetyl-beta-L-altrosamine N-acetyltransferase
MIVEQYGLVYKRLTESDIEVVRYWRNLPFIRNTMQFRDYITPNMQKAWFKNVNNKYNYYFIIEDKGKKIGMISCKDTEPDTSIAEGGIFIWDKNYWGTPIPVFAALSMLEAVFEVFRSGNASIATVSRFNQRAIEFNKLLGYSIYEDKPENEFIKLILTEENYRKKTLRLKKAAHSYTAGSSEFKVLAEPGDMNVDKVNEFLLKHKGTRLG